MMVGFLCRILMDETKIIKSRGFSLFPAFSQKKPAGSGVLSLVRPNT
jgi:hypothetical protein